MEQEALATEWPVLNEVTPMASSASTNGGGHHEIHEPGHCLTMDLVNFLLSRSTLDDVAQFLVLQELRSLSPAKLSIYEIGPDSLLRMVGAFGTDKGTLHERSILDSPAAGAALRDGRPQANFPIDAMTDDPVLPLDDGDGRPQVLWPLLTSTRLSGVMQIHFAETPDARELRRELEEVAPPISLVIDLTGAGNGIHRPTSTAEDLVTPRPVGHQSRNGHRQPGDGELTARQKEVLRLMSEGMTNGQIARVLRFSESTVRQETMAIYRAFGVGGRLEAVEVAQKLGLLTSVAS